MSLEKVVTVAITDVNEAPSALTISRNMVAEDSVVGTKIGSFVTSDPDNTKTNSQTFTYELLTDGNGLFEVEGDELKVAKAELNFEETATYFLTVKVTDSGEPPKSSEKDIQIIVQNRNDPPFNLQLSSSTVGEAALINSVIGTLSAEDPDVDQKLSYTVADSSLVSVKDDKLVVNGDLDFETLPHAVVEVTATDNGVPLKSITQSFNISVVDENDAPNNLMIKLNNGFSNPHKAEDGVIGIIEEVAEVDSEIGTIESVDPDRVDQATFELTMKSASNFKLDASTITCKLVGGKTVCSQKVYLAEAASYTPRAEPLVLEVIATDKGKLTIKQTWKFKVKDSNDDPTDISLISGITEIPENRGNQIIGVLKCVDKEENQEHFFNILNYWQEFGLMTESSSLTDQTTYLKLKKPLDAEKQSEYKLKVRCVDNGEPEGSFTKILTIQIKDINEAPTGIMLSHTEVPMTAKDGDKIGFLKVTDPDNDGEDKNKQSHTCRITDGDQFFSVVEENGKMAVTVKGQVPVNDSSVLLTLNCTDSGGLSYVQDIEVFITETADVPKVLFLQGDKEVNENEADQEVGTFVVINDLTSSVIEAVNLVFKNVTTKGSDAQVFNVNGNKLMLTSEVDFEATPSLEVFVQATGSDSDKDITFEIAGTFKVTVKDVNEAPEKVKVYGGGYLEENSPPGTEIGDLNTVDPEPYQTYEYTLLSVAKGNSPNPDPQLMNTFKLEGRTLVVGEAASVLDYEVNKFFTLLVQTVDSGTPPLSLNASVIIVLENVNDAPSDISALGVLSIPEDADPGTVVAKLSVTDEDVNQTHRCIVNNIQEVPFTIVNKVELAVSRADLDYETQRSVQVQVTCQDESSGFLKVTKLLTVNVTDVNEPPYNITMSNLQVPEGASVGEVVGEIRAIDPDSSEMIVSIVGESAFKLTGTNTLTTAQVFDFEQQDRVTVTVRVADEAGMANTKEFTIKIIDVNEKPTAVTVSSLKIKENSPLDTEIGTLTTTDPDKGQSFTYTLTANPPTEGLFTIKNDKLLVAGALDYEQNDKHRISVTSYDNGNPPKSVTMDFDVEVTNVNDRPTDITVVPGFIEVYENEKVQTRIADITVVDEETDQMHSCDIVNENTPFEVKRTADDVTHLIIVTELNFEEQAEFVLTLHCSDGEFGVEKEIVVSVKNINEPPTGISISGPKYVPFNATAGFKVGTLTVEDEDNGQTHMIFTKGVNSDLLQVKDGDLVLKESIPKEMFDTINPTLKVAVEAVDNGQPPLNYTENFTFKFTKLDITALQLPEITMDNTEVKEDVAAGTIIGQIYDTKNSETDAKSVQFSITDDANNLFEIKDNNLVLKRTLDKFMLNSADVTIQAKHLTTGEIKSRPITVLISRSDLCYNNGKTCDENARCIPVGDIHQCQCVEDFSGNGYTCEKIDNCEAQQGTQQCGPKGTCFDGISSFSCICKEGYSGEYCDIAPEAEDPCTDNKCKNNAACEVNGTSYVCICAVGWEGDDCGTNVDNCRNEVCGRLNRCKDGNETYACICGEGKVGYRCQFSTPNCEDLGCGLDDICTPQPDGRSSACSPAERNLKLTIKCLDEESEDFCVTRYLNFIEANVLLPASAEVIAEPSVVPNVRKERSTLFNSKITQSDRVTREIVSSQQVEGAQRRNFPYLLNSEKKSNGDMSVTVVVMDTSGVPYTQQQIVDGLVETCDVIAKDNLNEDFICPAINAMTGGGDGDGGDGTDSGASHLTAGGFLGKLIIYGFLVVVIQAITAAFI